MITRRDLRLLEHFQKVKAMTSSQAALLLCPEARQREVIARRRLRVLFERGHLNRTRTHVAEPYVYYTGKKYKTWEHTLRITDFYIRHSTYIRQWTLEPIILVLRPDVLAEVEIYSKRFLIVYEAQISGYVNVEKYERLYMSGKWRDVLPVFPIVVAGGEFKESKIIKVIGEDDLVEQLSGVVEE